jgi:histidyl-tRNA synthetase
MAELDAEAVVHFEAVQAILKQHGVAYEINPRLVRGLDYYNRTVFEWVTTRLGAQGTICAGGRYDGLIEQIGGKPAPACGFAMGIERLLALLQEDGMQNPVASLDVYLVHQGEQAAKLASTVAEQLRDDGLSVLLHCGGGSFKSQMKKADGSGALCAVIIGDDEAQAGQATLKPLRGGGEQGRVALTELQQKIRELNLIG